MRRFPIRLHSAQCFYVPNFMFFDVLLFVLACIVHFTHCLNARARHVKSRSPHRTSSFDQFQSPHVWLTVFAVDLFLSPLLYNYAALCLYTRGDGNNDAWAAWWWILYRVYCIRERNTINSTSGKHAFFVRLRWIGSTPRISGLLPETLFLNRECQKRVFFPANERNRRSQQ